MPSLRRTFSSPARSSPYPSNGNGSVRGGHGPSRRPSGSDTSNRRVLADIEWWRVVDGQRELEPEQEHNENEETDPSTAQESPRSPAETIADALADLSTSSTTIAAELVLQQSSTSGPSEASQEDQQEEPAVNSPVRFYGPLGIGRPRTPLRRESSTSSVSSSSSVESSPDSILFTPRESLSFTFNDFCFADTCTDSPTSPTATRPVSLGAIKSYSFSGFSSKSFEDDEDDVFCLPTHHDFAGEDLFA